ncbi:MAG: efflux RND transporter permease subunit [Nocardioides sp.]
MIRRIVDSSIKFPLLVAGLVLGLFALGFTELRETPVDALPEFAPVYVEVQTESLGLSAVEVEQLITAPMEQLLLNGVPWLDDIDSESIPGLSSIVMVFEPGTDPLEARQVVQERLAQGRDLPRVAKAPVMLQPLSSTSRVMMVRLDSLDLSPIEQSLLARWTIKPALMGVPGVANVAIWGQREQQMQVQVDPERLQQHGVALEDVVTTAANALWVSPLTFVEASTPGTGGFIDTPNQRLGIQHVLPITEPEELAQVAMERSDGSPVLSGGAPVQLGDTVEVVEDHQPLIGDAVANDTQGLMLVVEKFPEANTLEVTEAIEQTLAQLGPGLSGVQLDTDVFRPASYLESAMGVLGWVLLAGFVLMLMVLALLYDWRVAAVVAVSLPTAVVAAGLVLHLRDATMNIMLFAGLVAAAAAVIDDAVIGFDSALRRERELGGASRGLATSQAIQGLRRPMTFATLIMLSATVAVFYVGLRDGLSGAFFWSAITSYALALVISLLVSLTVTPVLSLVLLRGRLLHHDGSRLAGRVDGWYGKVLPRTVARPAALVASFAVVALAGLLVTPLLDADMTPGLEERTLLVRWDGAPGTSAAEMARITSRAATELRTVPGVQNVGAHVGRALASDEVTNVNSGQLWVALSPDADHDATTATIRDVTAGYPGIDDRVLTYSQDREAAHGLGAAAPDEVVVRVFGQDLDVLDQKAMEIAGAIDGVPGAESVTAQTQPQEPQVEVQVDLASAREFGLSPGAVRRAAAVLVNGVEVGSLFERQKVFEVIVVGTPDLRGSLSRIRDLRMEAPTGDQVRLGDIADVQITPVPTVVRHSSVSRYVDVVTRVQGRGIADVTADIEAALAGVSFPLEYHAEIVGELDEDRATLTQFGGLAGAALLVIFLLFQAFLRSWKLAGVAMVGLPLALSGGMLAAAATGAGLGIGVLVGMLVLVGVYTRSLLALMASFLAFGRPDGRRPDLTVVVRGARERFLPTLTSALALSAALLPIVVVGSRPGLELLHPMAVVVLGGLVTTTTLSLFLLPLMYVHTAPGRDPVTELDEPDPRPAERSVPVATTLSAHES